MLWIDLRRRILLVLMGVVVVAVSTAIGIGLADWPFLERSWRVSRLADGGEWPDSFYTPVVRIGTGVAEPLPPPAAAGATSIAGDALADAARWAEANNSVALLVAHRGQLILERYWQGMTADQMFSGRAMSRSLLGPMFGLAVRDGRVALGDKVEKFLTEWQGEPRGAITVRQLLQNVSGLEEMPLNALATSADAGPIARLRVGIGNLLGKNARLSLGNDFARTALSFRVAHEAGYRFALSNANAQLAGVILERAFGEDYERLVERLLWRPLRAGPAEFYMDRANGMPAVYCCLRATPRGFLRLGVLLASGGTIDGKQLLPPGWIAGEMTRGSQANPLYGLQIWSGRARAGLREYTPGSGVGVRHGEDFLADDIIWLEGGGGRTIWAIPSQQLVIVRLGRASPTWDASWLPNKLLRGLTPAR